MKKPLLLLSLFLSLKALFAMWYVASGYLGLGPDEAQYWTWSRELALGYYSKPPGIAWQIYLGTQIFGATELGVRFASIALSFCLPLAVYTMAREARLQSWSSFWAGMMMAFSPLGIMSSLLATTDGGMVLFWTLGCLPVVSALAKGKTPNYYLVGTFILLGALFKWPVFLLWPLIAAAMLPFPELRSRHFVGGMLLSLGGLLPALVWNSGHDWATFRHVLATMQGGHGQEVGTTPLSRGNFFDFLGAQAALLSPILFGLLLLSFWHYSRNLFKLWPALLFCGGVTLSLLAAYSTLALFQKMQGNWCVFAYPTGIVYLAWYACEKMARGGAWVKGGTVLSVLLCAMLLAFPSLQEKGVIPLAYKANPFKHNLGWKTLGVELQKLGYDPKQHFLFGDKYQMTSILSFYAPGQKRAYFFNLQGARKNQFSYWPSMADERIGQDGFFVLAENAPHLDELASLKKGDYAALLPGYFEKVEYRGTVPLYQVKGVPVKEALVFKGIRYNGKEPGETDKY